MEFCKMGTKSLLEMVKTQVPFKPFCTRLLRTTHLRMVFSFGFSDLSKENNDSIPVAACFVLTWSWHTEISSEVEPDEHHSSYPRPSILSSCPESEEEISASFSFKLALETRDKYRMPFCPLNVSDSWAFPHRGMPAAARAPWQSEAVRTFWASWTEHLSCILHGNSQLSGLHRASSFAVFTSKPFPIPPHLLVPRTRGLSWVSLFEDGRGLLKAGLAARKANRTQSISKRMPTRL